MRKAGRWTTLLALSFLTVGFRAPEETDTVRIVSIAPEPEETLHAGDRVRIHVEVEYNLVSAASATIMLVVQQGESGKLPLANETQVVQKGAGTVVLGKEIEIPDTAAIQVFTPLTPQGATSTQVVDRRAYKVVKD